MKSLIPSAGTIQVAGVNADVERWRNPYGIDASKNHKPTPSVEGKPAQYTDSSKNNRCAPVWKTSAK